MRKILFVLLLISAFSLCGCSGAGSAMKEADGLLAEGDYAAALEILEEFRGNQKVDAMIAEAEMQQAVASAKVYMTVGSYSEALSALQPYVEYDEAAAVYEEASLYNGLSGYWKTDEYCVSLSMAGTAGQADIVSADDNYWGYSEGMQLWSNVTVVSPTEISMDIITSDITGETSTESCSAAYDAEAAELTVDGTTWKKTDEDGVNAARSSVKRLSKTYNGVTIRYSDMPAMDFIGKNLSDMPSYVCTSKYETATYYRAQCSIALDYSELIFEFLVFDEGCMLTEDIYAGMTVAQLLSHADEFTSLEREGNGSGYIGSMTKNGNTVSLTFNVTDNVVDSIYGNCDAMYQKAIQQDDDLRAAKEAYEAEQQAAEAADTYYSTDGLKSIIGFGVGFVGDVLIIEPMAPLNLFYGDLFFIERYDRMNAESAYGGLVICYDGHFIPTDRTVRYGLYEYPVYRAVNVID